MVRADNAPVAAALRALAPRLLAGLAEPAGAGKNSKNSLKNKADQELTALRVEVQVDRLPPTRPVRPRAPLPLDKLAGVAKGLSDSPLKEALEQITGGQAKRSTRSKR